MPDDAFPLPVARLHRRARNAKSSKDGHDSAWFAFEVSIRLGVAAAPPDDPAPLARGALGRWVGALTVPRGRLADGRLVALADLQREVAGQASVGSERLTARQLVSALAAYRNAVVGHGSTRPARFYEHARDVLLAALEAAFEAHLFLPAGGRLVWIDSVEVSPGGQRRARALELHGEAPRLLDREGTAVPDPVLARRLHLRTGDAWHSLHPWATFDEDDERLYCFNGLGRTAAQFLDYGSGEFLAGEALEAVAPGIEADLRQLLSSPRGPAPVAGADDEQRTNGAGVDFVELGLLGRGTLGEVVLARQQSIDRLVAVKTLSPGVALDSSGRARFRREVRALGRSDHPHVAKILSAGDRAGRPYFVMEYVRGVDLSRVLAELPAGGGLHAAIERALQRQRDEHPDLANWLPAPSPEVSTPPASEDDPHLIAGFAADLARALAHLHDRGIVHRDVKPANLMLTWPEGRPVLLDLGLAALDDASRSLTTDAARGPQAKTGEGLEHLRYCAPEQFRVGGEVLDGRVDVYALGAVTYELLAHRPLFAEATAGRPVDQVLFEEPAPLVRVAPATPRALARVVHRALAKNPARRFGTATAFAEALEPVARGRSTGSGWLQRLAPWSRRSR